MRRLAEFSRHRLFLSATPHNDYGESWQALLEMRDPQRFARGRRPCGTISGSHRDLKEATVQDSASNLTITARGPAAQGRLSLAEVARLCGEFQATLERIALSLYGATSVKGRRPKEVVRAVRVEFTGFRQGSAVLELELPAPTGDGDLLEEALAVLVDGATAVRAERVVPEAFTPLVIDGLLRFLGGLGDDTITEIVLSRAGRPLVTADAQLRRSLQDVRRRVQHAETTIVGLLQMGDFAPSGLRCRIDTVHASVACTFDETLADTVLSCLNSLVVASGTGEFAASGGVLRGLHLSRLAPVTRPQEATLDGLARQQQVRPWPQASDGGAAHADFGASGSITDEEFAVFLAGALSARGER